MDIDKLIQDSGEGISPPRFGSLMDIDKLILVYDNEGKTNSFGSLMDIDKLIPLARGRFGRRVLVL